MNSSFLGPEASSRAGQMFVKKLKIDQNEKKIKRNSKKVKCGCGLL